MPPRTPKLDANGGFAEPTDNCCTRFVNDITGTCACRPSFRAADGSRDIDIPASFSPDSLLALGGKLVNIGVAAYTLSIGFGEDPRIFWFAYLTNWNCTSSTLYLLLSLFNSIIPVAQPPLGQSIVSFRVKLTWILFTWSANIGLVVTIAYWTFIYDGNDDMMTTVFLHGILTAFVLLDGFGINAIPIRLRHYLELCLPFASAYLIWSYVHAALDIGNPDELDEDPETNDDLIYGILDWKNDPKSAGLVAAGIVLGLSPALQALLWVVSGFRRRYVVKEDESDAYSKMAATV